MEMKNAEDNKLIYQTGKHIKELRAKQGVSQETFYLDTKININRIERGNVNISVSTIEAICDYFDISPEDFFAGIDVYNEAYLRKTGLNERQIKAVFYMKKNGRITNKESGIGV